jgi:hypothetical protein
LEFIDYDKFCLFGVCLSLGANPQGNHNYLVVNDSQGKSQFPFTWSLRAAKEIAFCLDGLEGLTPKEITIILVVTGSHGKS